MSEFYFDVGAWESQRDQQQQEEEAEGKKRKRPSKKDLVSAVFVFGVAELIVVLVGRTGSRSRRG